MVAIFFEPSLSTYLYNLFLKTKYSSFIFSIMKPTSVANPSASKEEFLEPSLVSKLNRHLAMNSPLA
jgi:hypothetical protein